MNVKAPNYFVPLAAFQPLTFVHETISNMSREKTRRLEPVPFIFSFKQTANEFGRREEEIRRDYRRIIDIAGLPIHRCLHK